MMVTIPAAVAARYTNLGVIRSIDWGRPGSREEGGVASCSPGCRSFISPSMLCPSFDI